MCRSVMVTVRKCSLRRSETKSGKVGERLGIDGEGPVLELVVDVEIEHVGGDAVGAETVGDFTYLRLGSVAVARLLESERPQRRQRRESGEIGVAFHDLLRSGAVEEVVVERATFRAEGDGVARLLAEVEPGAPGVVEEKAVARACR